MYFQLYVPAGVWGIILVALLVVLAHAGMYFFDRWYERKKFIRDNETAGIIFGVLSLIYSLIIASVIVAVWENYEELNRTIEKESDHLNSVLIHGDMLPDTLRLPITVAITDYCDKVITEEWNMEETGFRLHGSAIPELRLLLFKTQNNSKVQGNLLSVIDTDLTAITSMRRERLSHTRAYVPELIWMILNIGSLMIICFSYFLHMETKKLRRIMLSFLWTLVGMSLFLVYMLDHPFIGSTQVSKAPYQEIMRISK